MDRFLFTGLTAGGYLLCKDSKDCEGTLAVTITQPTQLVLLQLQLFSCSATNKQTATVTITVPTTEPPYSYSFDNGTTL
jgi:hypothetical protein